VRNIGGSRKGERFGSIRKKGGEGSTSRRDKRRNRNLVEDKGRTVAKRAKIGRRRRKTRQKAKEGKTESEVEAQG